MKNKSFAVGADIGGTHTTAALVDLDKMSIVPGSSTRENVDSHAPYNEILDVWSRAINNARTQDVNKVGVAIPGPFDYENGICLISDQGKYEKLYGLNIKELLSQNLQCTPRHISMINDAAAFLQGEVFGGAAKGYEKALGVTLGTGLGSAIYKNHISLNANLWEFPFKGGIAEDYLCTRWFIGRYKELTGNTVTGVRELSSFMETNVHVQSIFYEFGKNLADFLIEFLVLAPSQVVIIGGNIARSFPLFKDLLLKNLYARHPDVIIKPASLGEEAALIGAASCWNPEASATMPADQSNYKSYE